MANIKEIAVLSKVSQSTASIVLSGKSEQYRISPKTQQRVLDAARELDYQPNISARRLRSSGETVAPIIAVFWTMDTRSQLIARYLKGVQQAVQQLQTEYEILIQPYMGSKLSDIRSLTTGTRFNAAIIANPTEEDEQYLERESMNVPIVLYQRDSTKYCAVNADNFSTGKEVARLFAARGRTQVGMLVPDVSSKAIQLRVNGFIEGCSEYGLSLREESVVYAEFSEHGGYLAGRQLGSLSSRPEAVFFLSDQMAVGGLYAFHESGISVPNEIEVVGHDDDALSRYSIPALTTMHLPVEEMAEACVRLAADMITHKVISPVTTMYQSHLVVRQSCGDFPK
jgi:LacI family transcriptional regulator